MLKLNHHIQTEHVNVGKYSREYLAFCAANQSFEYDLMTKVAVLLIQKKEREKA